MRWVKAVQSVIIVNCEQASVWALKQAVQGCRRLPNMTKVSQWNLAEGFWGSGVLVPSVLSFGVDCFHLLWLLEQKLSDTPFASFSISSSLSHLNPDMYSHNDFIGLMSAFSDSAGLWGALLVAFKSCETLSKNSAIIVVSNVVITFSKEFAFCFVSDHSSSTPSNSSFIEVALISLEPATKALIASASADRCVSDTCFGITAAAFCFKWAWSTAQRWVDTAKKKYIRCKSRKKTNGLPKRACSFYNLFNIRRGEVGCPATSIVPKVLYMRSKERIKLGGKFLARKEVAFLGRQFKPLNSERQPSFCLKHTYTKHPLSK